MTVVDVVVALTAGETIVTCARVRVNAVTASAVNTRYRATLVNFSQAVQTSEASVAGAEIRVDAVNALPVSARV